VFPVISAFIPLMSMNEGPVDFLIWLDIIQWLTRHIEDSWDPDNDMQLMKTAFGLGCALTFALEAKFEIEAKRKKSLISHDSLRCQTPKI
jgi:hypothetical protein